MRANHFFKSCIFAAVVFSMVPFAQAADKTASLSLSPASGNKSVGDSIVVSVNLNTGGQAVGAVDLKLNYSSNLQYVKADATGSVFNTEVTPPQDASNTVRFARTRFDTGYTGSKGLLLKITFKTTAVGDAKLSFNEGDSQVIAYSDSSNILKSSSGATYSVAAAAKATATPQATATPTPAATVTPTPTPTSTVEPSIEPTSSVTITTTNTGNVGPSTAGRLISFAFFALSVGIGVAILLRRFK